MPTRWLAIFVVALALAAMFTASWLARRPPLDTMTLRELTQVVRENEFFDRDRFQEAAKEYSARPQDTRWDELFALLRDENPDVRSAAASCLQLEELWGPELADPDSVDSRRALQLRPLLDDDAVSLRVLTALTRVCEFQGWTELPDEAVRALRRHLTARTPGVPVNTALFCVMQFGRLCLPLQTELLAIDATIANDSDAAFLANALGAIAWNNGAVVDRLVTLLGPRHARYSDVISNAAMALERCGEVAAPAVPRLLDLVTSSPVVDVRAKAAVALARVSPDPDIAERALTILLRDHTPLVAAREREWTLAASRLAARVPASPSAQSVLRLLDARAAQAAAEHGTDATYDAAIALVTSALGDDARRRHALTAVNSQLTRSSSSSRTDPAGFSRHAQYGAAIELLLDLHLAHPEAKVDLDVIRKQLDSLANAQATWVRDWAHHQRSRLPR